MAIGDDAAAGGMALVPGSLPANELDTEDNRTRDYLANGPDKWKPGVVVPVAKGGTGSANASDARTALGAANRPATTVDGSLVGAAGHGLVAVEESTQTIKRVTGPLNAGYIPATLPGARTIGGNLAVGGGVSIGGGGTALDITGSESVSGDVAVGGHVYVPGAIPAVSGFTIGYINSDGRLSKGASSERYKTAINRAPEIPDVFEVPIASYVMIEDPEAVTRYGPIAEDLADNPATAEFVVYDAEGRPESFDMLSYAFACIARLNTRVAELEADR